MSEGEKVNNESEKEVNVELADESPVADESHRSPGLIAQLVSLMRKLTVGQELTQNNLQMPDGFEGKDTGIERFQMACLKHTDLLIMANDIEDPVLRLVQVIKWMFTLGQAFQLKKPLNPVLGEVSVCKYFSNQPKDGTTKNSAKYQKEQKPKTEKGNTENGKEEEEDVFYALAEQVSHHPPKSAYVAENKKRGIAINGYSKASIRFLGASVKLSLVGRTNVSFEKFNEVYTYTPPSISIQFIGFVLEYSGETEISCSGHPYVAKITYKEKPYFRGKYHQLKGKIIKRSDKEGKVKEKDEEVIMKLKGGWNEEVKFEDLRNNKTYTYSASDYPPSVGIPVYPPFDSEIPQSSRKVWNGVKTAPDAATSAKAKREVEEEQRRKAKELTEKGEEHKPLFFSQPTNLPEKEKNDDVWVANPGVLQSVVF